MRFWRRLTQSRGGQAVPADIYISLVDALYNDFRSLFIGSIAASITALITAWKTGEPLLYACSLSIALLACARAVDVRAYLAARPELTTSQKASEWERRYVFGAAAHVALLGTWCLVAFAKTSDPFVQIFSFSLTLAYLIGVSGRNFASNLLVKAQIVAAGVPMCAALFMIGGAYYAIFAFVLLPFFASLKYISDRLRKTLLDAVIASRDVSLLATRFNTALNNMPHGLCMFDAERRLVVANSRFAELFNVGSDVANKRADVHDLLLACVRGGTLSGATAEQLAEEIESRLLGLVRGDLSLDIQTGRNLTLTFHPMENGGSVVLIEDVTERRASEAKINQLARYDSLTGLPNRAFFRNQMEEALAGVRRRGPCAVHFIDLDQFKQVNDTLGHPCGDELLCAVADRLRNVVRETDVVARFGGDEFVVLQCPVGHPKDAASLAARIVESLGDAFEISGHQIVVGASIGIAMAPVEGANADLLLKNADMALYRAKSDGRGSWRFFEPSMDVNAQARRSMQLDLRSAMATGALRVYYQPIYNLHTKRISVCEALLRWPHPERGMIPPGEFIAVAEEMGLICEIGNMVLRQACMECVRWPDEVRVAVNMSPIQFKRGNVAQVIREALAASGLPAHRLEIEITESVFLQDTEATRICLDQLQDIGVRISLDDFGTGYSSLSYLHSFPLNKVKIDRSFLQGVETSERSLTLIKGVARLSAELNMQVVVEGVETEDQLALIAREKSVEEVQGFLFSAAVTDREIRKMLFAGSEQVAARVA